MGNGRGFRDIIAIETLMLKKKIEQGNLNLLISIFFPPQNLKHELCISLPAASATQNRISMREKLTFLNVRGPTIAL